jgi:plastocyanin
MNKSQVRPRVLTRLARGIGGWAVWCSPPLLAATVNVDIIDYAFSPDQVTVNVNDTVQWNWQGNYHSTTSNDGLWDSYVYNVPYSFPYTFSTAGTYPYFCSVHYFSGTVTVQAGNTPPTVLLSDPADGTVLSAPANLTLQASASDSGGSVASVGFFQGADLLGSAASGPYSMPVNSLPAGDYTFSAVATDDGGLSATNAVTVHVVNPVPVILSGLRWLPGQTFQFSYSANPGLTYVVQRSANLQSWDGIRTNMAASNPVVFQDPGVTISPAYYRVFRRPNP